jgi:hypothetical protein
MSGYISVPGYPYPIAAKFAPTEIDVSSGEPIVRRPDGYWVWGRGCTQPGGGIVPAWGFVRNTTGAGAVLPLRKLTTGVGATTTSSSIVPGLIAGGAVLVAVAAVIALATRDRQKTVEDEAMDAFPPPYGRANTPARKILAYKASAARCFYRELRDNYTPDEAKNIVQRAIRKDRGWLARAGASVGDGCAQLRSHTPMIYGL